MSDDQIEQSPLSGDDASADAARPDAETDAPAVTDAGAGTPSADVGSPVPEADRLGAQRGAFDGSNTELQGQDTRPGRW